MTTAFVEAGSLFCQRVGLAGGGSSTFDRARRSNSESLARWSRRWPAAGCRRRARRAPHGDAQFLSGLPRRADMILIVWRIW